MDDPSEEFLVSLRSLSVTDAIVELNAFWWSKWMCDAYQINRGDCELYACCLEFIFPGAEALWGDNLLSEAEYAKEHLRAKYAYHCITKYKDKYYDSEHPFGVDDFRVMSAFHSGVV